MNDLVRHTKAIEIIEGFEVDETYHICILEILFQLQCKMGLEKEKSRSKGPARSPVER